MWVEIKSEYRDFWGKFFGKVMVGFGEKFGGGLPSHIYQQLPPLVTVLSLLCCCFFVVCEGVREPK